MAGNEAEIGADGVSVDASLVARAFGLAAELVPGLMRSGAITSRLEQGADEDAGTWRLTFFHGNARFTLIVADDGRILRRSTLDYGSVPLPSSVRRR